MSETLNVTTSRFSSAVAGAGVSAEVVLLTSMVVMVPSIDSLTAPASRPAARLSQEGSVAGTVLTEEELVATLATRNTRSRVQHAQDVDVGCINVLMKRDRQATRSGMGSTGDLPNAVTLNTVASNMARVFGTARGVGITGST